MNSKDSSWKSTAAVASLRRRYLLALASIALLAVVGQGILQWTLWKQTHDAQIVNTAGRQRMLSQRLTKAAMGVALAATDEERRAHYAELAATLREWRDAHHALKHREASRDLAGDNSADVIDLFAKIETPFEQISSAAAKILDDSRFAVSPPDQRWTATVGVITTEEDEFVAQMEKIVRQYASEANHRVQSVRLIELALFVTTLLVLAFEAYFVFRPAVHNIRTSVEQLEKTTDELRAARRAADAANIAKSEFLANMSHEIRTPMTAILGFTDVILNEPQLKALPPQRIEDLQTVKRNGHYLLQLINDILDVSKIEAGKLEIEPLPTKTIQLIGEVVSLMQVRAAERKIELRAEFMGPVPETVVTDPTRLQQILVNLISNAVKFTEVGSVQILTRFQDVDGGKQLQFDVVDTGMGMTEGQVERLFKPFSQADVSINRRFGGTGLGLSICKKLAEMMGGGIDVRSQPGHGSTFSVRIQVKVPDGTSMKTPPINVTFGGAASAPVAEIDKLKARVLLVEDGPDNQRLISFHLRRAGAEVTIAENGKVAVELLKDSLNGASPFDVVLMDMQMPVMDGYDATRILRNRGFTAPIIALTAHAMSGDREKCLAAGCIDFVSKPIDKAKLLETIAAYLPKSTPPAASNGSGAPHSSGSL